MIRLTPGDRGLASRVTIYPWHCDFNNHLNSRFAGVFADDVSDAVFTLLGLGRSELKAVGCMLVVARLEVDYLAQAFAGEILEITYEVGRVGRSSMILRLPFSVIGTSARPVINVTYTVVLVNESSGRSRPWSEVSI